MPYGAVVCVVELYECVSTGAVHDAVRDCTREIELGDFSPGRFAWLTRNLEPLREPLPMRGHQSLWTLSDDEIKQINERL